MKGSFISKGTVKSFFRQSELRVSKELFVALDDEIRLMLAKAAKRAAANRRTTALPHDL